MLFVRGSTQAVVVWNADGGDDCSLGHYVARQDQRVGRGELRRLEESRGPSDRSASSRKGLRIIGCLSMGS